MGLSSLLFANLKGMKHPAKTVFHEIFAAIAGVSVQVSDNLYRKFWTVIDY